MVQLGIASLNSCTIGVFGYNGKKAGQVKNSVKTAGKKGGQVGRFQKS